MFTKDRELPKNWIVVNYESGEKQELVNLCNVKYITLEKVGDVERVRLTMLDGDVVSHQISHAQFQLAWKESLK